MDVDGSSKKLRKPYTITKSRDRWSEEEHERFLDALLLFGREWKKIEDFVGTKTVIQIRSHAQKHFLKVQKNGIMTYVPPPRPKRDPIHPYPQKVSDDDIVPLQASMVYPSASSCLITSCIACNDKSMLKDYTSSEAFSSLDHHAVLDGVEGTYNQNFCWATGSSSPWLTYDPPTQGSQQSAYPVAPDLAEVYNFIGSMFDPDIKWQLGVYLQRLKEMDPITAKTVLTLVKNLTINLASPDFEPLRRWLSTYNANARTTGEITESASTVNHKYSRMSPRVHLLPSP